jgi:polysaccharide pyruvyl transferase WcaK-like protein
MGFGLDVARYVRPWEAPRAAQNRTVVGLSVMAHCDPRYIPRNDPPRYAAYVRKMAEFCAWLLRNDYAVLAAPSDIWADPRSFADVREVLRREHGIDGDPRLIELPVAGLADLASLFAACDYVIAARYHCIVLPWLLGKPVVALAYNRKQIDLMESMGQQAYCVDIDRFEVAELVEQLRALERNRDAIRAELRKRVARCRERLAQQYDHVLSPLVVAR